MNPAFLKRVKRQDSLAKWAITVGGMAIIFCVILILILIAKVSLPLFYSPDAELQDSFTLAEKVPAEHVLAVGMDEYRETGYVIDDQGIAHFFNVHDGSKLDNIQLKSADGSSALRSVDRFGRLNHVLLWDDGSTTVEQIKFFPFFDEHNDNKRSIRHKIDHRAEFPAQAKPQMVQARVTDEGRKVLVVLQQDGNLDLTITEQEESLFGDAEETTETYTLDLPAQGKILSLAMNYNGTKLFAGTDQGEILHYNLEDIDEPVLQEMVQAFADKRKITALNMVYGGVSLAVGDSHGEVTTWFDVRDQDSGWKLTRIHDLDGHSAAVEAVLPTLHDKSVISIANGGLQISHMTSERLLVRLDEQQHLKRFAMSIRGNGLIGLTDEGQIYTWKLDIPHPEISFKTLFGKVWYEGYPQPEYVWQSSAGSDDYEPKFSLTPLIFGTLKGTFYAMLFALPLAIFGAIYTSQFARPKFKGVIKPAVEVMAAVPTVIIGFLAALWLAPLIERSLGSMFLSLIMVPAALMISIALWQAMRKVETLKRVERGYEFLAIAPVVMIAVAVAVVLGPWLEHFLFAGDLKQWLFSEAGVRYDPRNCIIIAFAMGFAVIPIIFTIAEDSLSNVPPALKAASLALGASRWQTVWRVILPSASPGIFAGTMIGFGRAVGETMIVLMATGNTAIMDLSIFNGMRPLSANIAVEIPEAPVDGSLYRILFLSAVILFLMTFVVNTIAEIVRQRLRAKYGRF